MMARKIVIPGELVTAERKKVGSHVYMSGGSIYSDCLGLVDEGSEYASVVPLEGIYMPRQMDVVVGVIVSENFGSYAVDINAAKLAVIPKSTLRERNSLEMENIISARIEHVGELGIAELGGVRVFYGGEIIEVSAVKVPRIIGKNGSMLDVIRGGTGGTIVVGRNGRIWVRGGNTPLLIRALEKIQREAHTENLTQKMAAFIEEEAKKGHKPVEEPQPIVLSKAGAGAGADAGFEE